MSNLNIPCITRLLQPIKKASLVEVFFIGWKCVGFVPTNEWVGSFTTAGSRRPLGRSEQSEDEGFIPSNPASPARVQKSSEVAIFSFIYKYLIWFVYSVFQKALFSALDGLTFKKSLILQCFCLGMSKFYPREKEDVFRLSLDEKKVVL